MRHGQGYADLNFLIPELVDTIAYRKGTYYADEGNFSAAGAAHIAYRSRLDAPFAMFAAGENGYYRTVLGASPQAGPGDLLVAGEYFHNDGPWREPQGYRKLGGLIKYTVNGDNRGFSAAAMGYDGEWNSTDQVPLRAVAAGAIDRFGNVDPTTGGETHRYSVSGEGWWQVGAGRLTATAYGVDYALDLVSNFTYAIDTVNGDQFEQFEQRQYYGGTLGYEMPAPVFGRKGTFTTGLQLRYDDIQPVALYLTEDRVRHSTVREDDVEQVSYGLYASHDVVWADWFRTVVGLRFDEFHFNVASSLPENSGDADDSIVSPKLTMVFGPWAKTEYFVNVGRGFHSNDARGTTITVDPTDGITPAAPVDPLVKALGYEVGLRTAIIPQLAVGHVALVPGARFGTPVRR